MTDVNPMRILELGDVSDEVRNSLAGYRGGRGELLFDGKTARAFNGSQPGGFPFLNAALGMYDLSDVEKAVMRAALGIIVTNGIIGVQGLTGLRGFTGETGQPGKDGENGGRGEKGEKGERGDKGEQGFQGLRGPPGENGKPITIEALAGLLTDAFRVLGPFLSREPPTTPWTVWNNAGVLCITEDGA